MDEISNSPHSQLVAAASRDPMIVADLLTIADRQEESARTLRAMALGAFAALADRDKQRIAALVGRSVGELTVLR